MPFGCLIFQTRAIIRVSLQHHHLKSLLWFQTPNDEALVKPSSLSIVAVPKICQQLAEWLVTNRHGKLAISVCTHRLGNQVRDHTHRLD